MTRTAPLATALLLSLAANAQSVLVVDLQGGPGSQFTQIQPAIDAAAPNDTIVVRPAVGPAPYRGFRVDKPLRIIGEPGARVGSSATVVPLARAAMEVRGIPAGSAVTLCGLEEDYEDPFTCGLWIDDNRGAVFVEELLLECPSIIEDSDAVSFTRTQFDSVSVSSSGVTFTDCSAAGAQTATTLTTPAMRVRQSAVTIAGGRWTGADAIPSCCTEGPAITIDAGTRLTVTGDTTTLVQGGQNPIYAGASAIATTGGAILLDPDPVLVSSGGMPVISGSATVQHQRVPYLLTEVASGVLSTSLYTWIGSQVWLFTGELNAPVQLATGIADLWIATPVLLAAGQVQRRVHHDRIPIPSCPEAPRSHSSTRWSTAAS